MRFGSSIWSLLARYSSCHVRPNFGAIFDSQSPDLTVYVVGRSCCSTLSTGTASFGGSTLPTGGGGISPVPGGGGISPLPGGGGISPLPGGGPGISPLPGGGGISLSATGGGTCLGVGAGTRGDGQPIQAQPR